MVNKVILLGNLGQDPEVRHLESGATVARFSIATNERYKDRNGETQTITEWHNVVVWRGLAEVAEKYLKKGSQLYVEGKLTHRKYQDKDGNERYTTEVVANNFQMLGGRDMNQGGGNGIPMPTNAPKQVNAAPAQPQPQPTAQPKAEPENPFVEEDDLPF